eukprot:363433-Chlamydomonas_euryale.AAC.22
MCLTRPHLCPVASDAASSPAAHPGRAHFRCACGQSGGSRRAERHLPRPWRAAGAWRCHHRHQRTVRESLNTKFADGLVCCEHHSVNIIV